VYGSLAVVGGIATIFSAFTGAARAHGQTI